MAFPTVQTADTTSGTVISNSTSWTVTYPANIASGNLLFLAVAIDGAGRVSSGLTGWSSYSYAGSSVGLHIAVKSASGSESGTFSLTINASEQGAWRMFRITDWAGTLGNLGNAAPSSDVVMDPTSGTSTTPDPPNLDPFYSNTSDDTLWAAVMAADTSRTISAYPSSYTTTAADVSGGANGATLGTAFRQLNATSENPGAFTISASDSWAAFTVAIRPATAPAAYSHSGWGIPLNSA